MLYNVCVSNYVYLYLFFCFFFFFQAEDGIRDGRVTGVQTCALPISGSAAGTASWSTSASCRSPWRSIDITSISESSAAIRSPMTRSRCSRSSAAIARSEERRVGKECRSRRSPDHEKKKKNERHELKR